MKFELRPADTLTGPRVYSTDLHPRTIMAGVDEQKISRSLKVKLLTKGVVTMNGGHLLNPAALNLLQQNELLLTQGLLLPAIREDKGSFEAYVVDNQQHYDAAGWSERQVLDALQFLEASVRTVLPWKVEQAQEQYRERLVWGLTSEGSFARRRLLQKEFGSDELERLAQSIREADLKEDAVVDRLIAQQQAGVREDLSRFADAAYHLVGTSVVNCETGLDVSELADRRLAELGGGDVYGDERLLTDTNVFIRCCFESAMQAINETAFPTHVLDVLPFDAIAAIRVRLQEQGFQEKYDLVIRTFVDRLRDTTIADIESWEPDHTVDLVSQLATHFRAYFDEEIPGYRKAIQERRQGDAIRSGVAAAKGAGGGIPGIGELMSVIDGVHEGASALRAAGDAVAYLDHGVADRAAHAHRDEMMDVALRALSPNNEAKILTALKQIRSIAAEWQKPN